MSKPPPTTFQLHAAAHLRELARVIEAGEISREFLIRNLLVMCGVPAEVWDARLPESQSAMQRLN